MNNIKGAVLVDEQNITATRANDLSASYHKANHPKPRYAISSKQVGDTPYRDLLIWAFDFIPEASFREVQR